MFALHWASHIARRMSSSRVCKYPWQRGLIIQLAPYEYKLAKQSQFIFVVMTQSIMETVTGPREFQSLL